MNMPFLPNQVFSLATDVIVTEVDGESVLLNSANGQYFGLNDTGTQILLLIQKQRNFADICNTLKSQYPDHDQSINNDVQALLANLLSEKLINYS